MTLLASFVKQPREKCLVPINYDKVIAGRVVDSMSLVLEVPAGMSSEGYVIAGADLLFHAAGGTDKAAYRFTALMTIVIGGFHIVQEDEIDFVVTAI